MRYKLRLTRSVKDFATVDIPGDFFIKPGDTILYDGKHHELKHVIRPAIDVLDKNKHPSAYELDETIPILIVGDEYLEL